MEIIGFLSIPPSFDNESLLNVNPEKFLNNKKIPATLATLNREYLSQL